MPRETDSPAARALLDWYDAHRRSLPWRDVGNPYATWVSEIMLQQTRVETVIPYYNRFMADYPDVMALAAAPEDEVLKHWEGLGYYSRARNLHRGAKQIAAEGGVLPADAAGWRAVCGVGDYTAGAIASIALGQKAAAVDGNVIRVITRLTGLRENAAAPSVRREIAARSEALMPPDRPGDFNQALMDLGATVCVPAAPRCENCPLASFCDAYAAGDAEDLPVLPRKNPPKEMDWDLALIRLGDRVLVRQREERMLRGLWVFPMAEGHGGVKALRASLKEMTGLDVSGLRSAGEAKHIFTHQVWRMRIWRCDADPVAVPAEPWRAVTREKLEELALPSAMRVPRGMAFDGD